MEFWDLLKMRGDEFQRKTEPASSRREGRR